MDARINEPSGQSALTGHATSEAIDLSVVVPVYNEEGNIPLLCKRLFGVLDGLNIACEVIAVNDGSKDQSLDQLRVQAALSSSIADC